MTVLEKAHLLKAKVAQAEDLDYAIHVAFGDNKEESMAHMRHVADQAIRALTAPGFDRLDYDVRQQSLNQFDRLLEAELVKFPDYNQEKQEEHSRSL